MFFVLGVELVVTRVVHDVELYPGVVVYLLKVRLICKRLTGSLWVGGGKQEEGLVRAHFLEHEPVNRSLACSVTNKKVVDYLGAPKSNISMLFLIINKIQWTNCPV